MVRVQKFTGHCLCPFDELAHARLVIGLDQVADVAKIPNLRANTTTHSNILRS